MPDSKNAILWAVSFTSIKCFCLGSKVLWKRGSISFQVASFKGETAPKKILMSFEFDLSIE